MSESRQQFLVGLMVLVALSLGTALIIRFGNFQKEFQQRYQLQVHLDTAGGLYPSAPVLMNGLTIGNVERIEFDPVRGVIVVADIQLDVKIRDDSQAIVSRSLLGETAIEFVPGVSKTYFAAGARLTGQGASDPLAALQRLEGRASEVLEAFADTSREWQLVGRNVNQLVETNRGNLDSVIEQAAESLHQFTQTMQSANVMIAEANRIVADPRAQQALKETLVSLPALVEETRRTITASRVAVESVNQNLVNLSQVTEPVGQRGAAMVHKLDSSLGHLDSLLKELNLFAQVINQPNGSLQKLAADPSLYDNMDRSAQSLVVLLKNLEPILKDAQEFSDKIARNPELMGVGGVMRPSNGLRDSEMLNPQTTRTSTNTSGRSAIRANQ